MGGNSKKDGTKHIATRNSLCSIDFVLTKKRLPFVFGSLVFYMILIIRNSICVSFRKVRL